MEVQPAPGAAAAGRGARRGPGLAGLLLRGRLGRHRRVAAAADRQAERLPAGRVGGVPQAAAGRDHGRLSGVWRRATRAGAKLTRPGGRTPARPGSGRRRTGSVPTGRAGRPRPTRTLSRLRRPRRPSGRRRSAPATDAAAAHGAPPARPSERSAAASADRSAALAARWRAAMAAPKAAHPMTSVASTQTRPSASTVPAPSSGPPAPDRCAARRADPCAGRPASVTVPPPSPSRCHERSDRPTRLRRRAAVP